MATDKNIYFKILEYNEGERRFKNSQCVDNYLKDNLLDCYDSLRKFYLDAFVNSVSEERTYTVFVARRCAVLGILFLRALESNFTLEEYDRLQRSIFTDAGFRALVQQIAKKCYDDFNYNCRIYLYDDILIHGRAIGGLLSYAEDIFIETYQQLHNNECDLQKKFRTKYSVEELDAKFLKMIHIKTAVQSKNTLLLKPRFEAQLDNDFKKGCEQLNANEWRKRSYRCANAILNSDIPNACFIPHLKINRHGRECLKQRVNGVGGVGSSRFEFVTTVYKKRSLDTYTWLLPVADKAKAIFTIRCTNDYLIPFAFLPECRQDKMEVIESKIIEKLQCSSIARCYKHINEFSRLMSIWSCSDSTSVLYTEVIDMIFSLTALKLFLFELNGEDEGISASELSSIRNSSNIQNIMFNYAHEKAIEDLVMILLDPKVPPIFSYEEIEELICVCTDENQYIVNSVSSITKVFSEDRKEELIKVLECVAFEYGSASEREAHSLANSSFTPSQHSILMFRFPVKYSIEAFLNSLYFANDLWCYDNAPLKQAIAYILQFMDAGVLAVSTGRDKGKYILSVRPGEQSLATIPMQYAAFIPLMKEIEDRCKRQGRTPRSAFRSEFDYFMMLFERDDNSTDGIFSFQQLKQSKEQLIKLAEFFYSSGQSFDDYGYILREFYKESDEEQFEEKAISCIKWCNELYKSIVY